MKRLNQKGKEFINKPNEFSINSFIKNAQLFNEQRINEMFLNQYKIKATNSLSTKVSAVSFKAKNTDHVGFYKENIGRNHSLLSDNSENYKLILGFTTKSKVTNCDVYNVNYDPIDGGQIVLLKEPNKESVPTHNVSPLRNIQTLDGPKGDGHPQNFVVSLHEEEKLFKLESFKSPTPKKLEESVIKKNGLNFIKPMDDSDLPKAINDQELRLSTLVEKTFLFHMFNVLKSYNINEFIEFYIQSYKENDGDYVYSKKQGLDCMRIHKNELNNDKLIALLKNLYGEDNISFLVEYPRDLNNEFMNIFDSPVKINEFLVYSEDIIRNQEVSVVCDSNGERVKESRIKDFNPNDINDVF